MDQNYSNQAVCPNCNTRLTENAAFCPRCGNAVQPYPSPSPFATANLPPLPPSPPPKKSRKMIVFLIVASLLVIIALVFFILTTTHVICISHDFTEATCIDSKTCEYCEKTEGSPLGHDWKQATCFEPETCSRCQQTRGIPAEHIAGTWKTIKEATLTKPGSQELHCAACDNILETQETNKKLPQAGADGFNFTDEEFLDWLIDTSNVNVYGKELGFSNSTGYKIDYQGETGVMLLQHVNDNKDENICSIIFCFDNFVSSGAAAIGIASQLDPTFPFEDATYDLVYYDGFVHDNLSVAYQKVDQSIEACAVVPTKWLDS